MQKVVIICGTRPEAIKLIPVYLEAKSRPDLDVHLVSTGQHREMLQQIFVLFQVTPNRDLQVMTTNQTLAGLTSLLFAKISQLFEEIHPDIVVVQGDTSSAMVASMVSFYMKIKVAHVEAGLRTYDKYSPFPEEINRRVIGLVADIHFAPTQKAEEALRAEGVSNVRMVGNTVVDSLKMVEKMVEANPGYYDTIYANLFKPNTKMILVTGHRRESFGEGFVQICTALKKISELDSSICIIYPVHLNPNVKKVVYEKLGGSSNIHLIDPVSYDQMVYLMRQSHIILTDSGGIQEEAPSLNKPIVVMRNTTERMEGIDSGCAVLAGNNAESILNEFIKIYSDHKTYKRMSEVDNPYGDGLSAKQIVNELLIEND